VPKNKVFSTTRSAAARTGAKLKEGLRSKAMFRMPLRTHGARRGLGRVGPVDPRISDNAMIENSRAKSGIISSLIVTRSRLRLREDRTAGCATLRRFHLFPGPEMTLRGLCSLVRPCFDFHDTRATAMFALPSGDDSSQW